MTVVAGVILAGGRGKRLGGLIKANLKVGGVILLERAVSSLGEIDGPILISTGHIPASQISTESDWRVVEDASKDYLGPLAGIAAAVGFLQRENIKADYLMSLAVDTPFFPQDFCTRSMELLDDNVDVVVAKFGAQIYPTNALWRLNSIAHLPGQLTQLSPNGIKGLMTTLSVADMELAAVNGSNPCQNVNRMSDLIACGHTHNQISAHAR